MEVVREHIMCEGGGSGGGVGGDVGWCGWMDGSFGCLMFAAWEREGIVGLGV